MVRPAAAAAVATTFGFPLALMIAVLLFLLVQSLLDARDPKLRRRPSNGRDTVVKFQEEDLDRADRRADGADRLHRRSATGWGTCFSCALRLARSSWPGRPFARRRSASRSSRSRRDGRLPFRRRRLSEWAPPAVGPARLRAADRPAPVRRALPGLRDVRAPAAPRARSASWSTSHLVAVSLLASYRTGLKIALWHSLLLFVVLYAQAARAASRPSR